MGFMKRKFSSSKPKTSTTGRATVLVLGGGGVGKSSLLEDVLGECQGECEKYQPTIWEVRDSVLSNNEDTLNVRFIDTGGMHSFPEMKRIAIKDADIFIMVYSLDDEKSKEDIIKTLKEIQDIRKQPTDSLPILIVGNKMDLMHHNQSDIFDNSKNGSFDKDKELSEWSRNQLKVSHRYQINTRIVKDAIFFLYSKHMAQDDQTGKPSEERTRKFTVHLRSRADRSRLGSE